MQEGPGYFGEKPAGRIKAFGLLYRVTCAFDGTDPRRTKQLSDSFSDLSYNRAVHDKLCALELCDSRNYRNAGIKEA